MLSRTAVGASAGALAAIGWALTLDALPKYCYLKPGRIGCGRSSVLLLPLTFSFWMLVGGALVYAGYRVLRVERGWWAAGIGSGLWFVLVLAVISIPSFYTENTNQEEVHEFFRTAYLVTACVSYGITALFVGRARPC
jgi:MFS family permease